MQANLYRQPKRLKKRVGLIRSAQEGIDRSKLKRVGLSNEVEKKSNDFGNLILQTLFSSGIYWFGLDFMQGFTS